MTPPEVKDGESNLSPETRKCYLCAYDLRGLPENTLCPECGTPIHEFYGFLIQSSSAAYVRRIKIGLMLLSVVFFLKIGALIMCAMPYPFDGAAPWWPIVPTAIMFAVGWVGYWLFAESDKKSGPPRVRSSARRLIRPALLIHVAVTLITGILITIDANVAGTMLPLLALLLVASGFALDFCTVTYAGAVARQLPDPELARKLHVLRWWITLLPLSCFGIAPSTCLLAYATSELHEAIVRAAASGRSKAASI